tara:strand:+ start:747 stop:1313 length:567 start_codon:yes stop_codon:yes gene_type:complete
VQVRLHSQYRPKVISALKIGHNLTMSFSPTAEDLEAVRAQCCNPAGERILGGRSAKEEDEMMRRAQVAAAARAAEAFAAGDLSAAREAVADITPGKELLLECACQAGQWDFATELAATGLDATAEVVHHSALYFACVAGKAEFVRTVIAALGPDADDLYYEEGDDFVAVAREHGHDGIAAMIEEYNDE